MYYKIKENDDSNRTSGVTTNDDDDKNDKTCAELRATMSK